MQMPKLTWLDIPTSDGSSYFDPTGAPLSRLEGVGRVNIFVGPNNGGKSRLLRNISAQSDYSFGLEFEGFEQLRQAIEDATARLEQTWSAVPGLLSVNGISRTILSTLEVPQSLSTSSDSLAVVRAVATQLANAVENGISSDHTKGASSAHAVVPLCKQLGRLIQEKLAAMGELDVDSLAPKEKVYIPVLRGLRPMSSAGSTDVYGSRTKTDYFHGARTAPRIFTGQTLYEEIRDHLLGPQDERERIRNYETFLAKEIFDTSEVTLIPRRDHDVVFIKLGNEPEYPIHDLGDGIQSIITLTYLFFVLERAWFFIEEPELFLHPGLQRRLLKLLLSANTQHRTFVTSHSNHFLDMTMDYEGVAIYGVSKCLSGSVSARMTVELLDKADQTGLSLLGVRTSSVLLVNATIWVEGITDRFYLRRLLQLYVQTLGGNAWRPSEDVHFSFVEYGGANAVHFSFAEGYEEAPINVQRLCGRALVVVDEDAGNNAPRKSAMEKVLGERLVVLPCREIENLIPPSAISAVVAHYEGTTVDSLPKFASEDIGQDYLGNFINKKLLQGNPKRKGGYCSSTGTVRDKRNFCERALEHMHDVRVLEEISPSGVDVLRRIYEFIRLQNGAG